MKAVIRFSDGLILFTTVQAYEWNDGRDVELPGILDVKRPNKGRVRVILNCIRGREWQEIPEYIEEKKVS